MKRLLLCFIAIALLAMVGCGDDNPGGGTNNNPTIAGFAPTQAARGQLNVSGRVTGTNLSGVVSVNLGEGIIILQFTSISANELEVRFSVSSSASAGARTITIVTSGGTATSTGALFAISDNNVPTASFVLSPNTGAQNTLYTMDATESDDSDGSIAGYRWDFGDGKSAQGRVITHRYAASGSFVVTLTVTDNDQSTDTATRTIVVANGFTPVPKFTITPPAGDTGTTFGVNASGSTDQDNAIVDYLWNFGDGTTAHGVTAEHVYSHEGTFTVTLTVTDAGGLKASLEKQISVQEEVFNDEQAEAEIYKVIVRFFRRYSELERFDAETIVEGWSISPECTGRDREIGIINDQKTYIKETEATITAVEIDVRDNHLEADADVAADFVWTETDDSHHTGSALHHFTFVFEDEEWQVCNFTVETGSSLLVR